MTIAFFVSSIGDTDLAVETAKKLQEKGTDKILLVSLTKTARDRIPTSLNISKITLPELLESDPDVFPATACTEAQLCKIVEFSQRNQVTIAYCGVPSVLNNEVPFQIAQALETPVVIANEFMFKPEGHVLETYLEKLKKPNIHLALPLARALADPDYAKMNAKAIGHLCIDAFAADSAKLNAKEIRASLKISEQQSFAFVSSTTQPVSVDKAFLECLLEELINHPNMQVRLGLHPGIQEMDTYLNTILAVYEKYKESCGRQFMIILPENIISKLQRPELFVNHPVFLKVNVNGTEAAYAADRVAQAVPGALINQGALGGKPAYHHYGTSYLPESFFAKNPASFFTQQKHPISRTKEELGLSDKTAPECLAEVMRSLP